MVHKDPCCSLLLGPCCSPVSKSRRLRGERAGVVAKVQGSRVLREFNYTIALDSGETVVARAVRVRPEAVHNSYTDPCY